MSANNEDTLRQFCDVTGADETRSRFFLESSNWQLEVALSSFYEHGGNLEEAPVNSAAPATLPTLIDSDMESPTGSPERPQKKDKKKTSSKFATLDSLHQESSSDEEEDYSHITKRVKEIQEYFQKQAISKKVVTANECRNNCKEIENSSNISLAIADELDFLKMDMEDMIKYRNNLAKEVEQLRKENDELRNEIARLKKENRARFNGDDDQGQAFYAGGSERSGQQIIGPGKGRKDIVSEMFKSVRERGAVVFEDEPSSTSRGRGALFSGVGYRLGQTSDDHEPVTPAGAAQPQVESRSVRLRLYREGFTVDDGALRLYSDPENAEFLFCIRRGEIPPELARIAGGGEVRVSLEDRRLDAAPASHGCSQAFTGKGHMLGRAGSHGISLAFSGKEHNVLSSPTPPTVGATAPVAVDASDRAANQRAAQQAVALDENAPLTTIQFRLADGSRLTGRFNHSHTVGDLRQYVAAAEPAYQLQNFALLTTFPSAELNDTTVTLAQANLLNTTLLQRLK